MVGRRCKPPSGPSICSMTETAEPLSWPGQRGGLVYFPSQVLTLGWLSLTHFSAAASGVSLSTAIIRATAFWSSLVHWNRLTRSYAGLPESANFFETILSRSYGG